MNDQNILTRLHSGEFDMKYTTPEYCESGCKYFYEYEIACRKIVKRRLSDGICSESKEYISDSDKLTFIREHPYFFPYDDDFK